MSKQYARAKLSRRFAVTSSIVTSSLYEKTLALSQVRRRNGVSALGYQQPFSVGWTGLVARSAALRQNKGCPQLLGYDLTRQ
jgi:hypothetical protein